MQGFGTGTPWAARRRPERCHAFLPAARNSKAKQIIDAATVRRSRCEYPRMQCWDEDTFDRHQAKTRPPRHARHAADPGVCLGFRALRFPPLTAAKRAAGSGHQKRAAHHAFVALLGACPPRGLPHGPPAPTCAVSDLHAPLCQLPAGRAAHDRAVCLLAPGKDGSLCLRCDASKRRKN